MANNSSWKDEGSLNFVLNNPGYQKAQAKYNEEHGIQSSNEAGNISLPAPYAILIEPYEKGNKTNVSNSGDNYQKTLNAYNEAKRRLIDQTDEARDIKDTWSAAPRVTLENGNLMLNGTRKFLDSDTGKELQKTLKDMEGQTYNSEDLNKQIEAWNATLSKMADEYSKAADSLNIANAALADTARNAEYHKLTLSDLQKVSNSATIGKGADARTSKKKIFVGFEWDDDGNLIERWVEAKKFFEEFNSVNDDEKRRAYRDLIVQANNGDVGAYSKLMYLNGGAEGKPANVEYNAVGDFFHTLGEHLLVGLSEAADFVTTYVPIFNTSRLTGRVVRAAESGDINEFFAPDEIRKNIDSYKETLAWEDAYFSELTPGSTALAAQTGNVVGNFLGMAYSIWAGGVGNSAAATMVTQGINKANQALLMTGNFTAFERTAITGTQQALGGAVRTSASTSQFLMPTAIVENFPRLSSFLADKALSFSQYTGIGLTGTSTGDALAGASRAATVTENTITMPGRTAGTLVARGTSAGNITATVVSGGTAMGSRTLGTLSGGALASEQVFAKGIQTAFRLAPLAGETVLRTTDQYFQKVYMGEDPGDMTEYIINNTAEALIWGGAFMAAGAKIRELKQIARAARQSPVSATAGGYSKADSSQSDWCGTRYNTPQEPQRLLTPGMELEKDIQDLVSSVVTVNGESFFVSPNRTAVATGYEGGEIVDGVMETTPTSIEFAPIPNSAGEAGAAFGAASAKKITKYEVEKTLTGADLIETAIDVETGTATTTRRHFDTLEAANDAAKTASVPKASPRTIANSDALQGANVAPLSVNGEVLPKVDGVTQVKVQRGIIYRTPDDMVEDLANIAGAEGWSAENQDRLYREYQQYVEEAKSAQENAIYVQEAPNYPKDIIGTDVEMYLRTAAWAKANGYSLVPMKAPARKTQKPSIKSLEKFLEPTEPGPISQDKIFKEKIWSLPAKTVKSVFDFMGKNVFEDVSYADFLAAVKNNPDKLDEIKTEYETSITDYRNSPTARKLIQKYPHFNIYNDLMSAYAAGDQPMELMSEVPERFGLGEKNKVEYFEQEKDWAGAVLEMSPDAYLREISNGRKGESSELPGVVSQERAEQYAEMARNGSKMPSVYIDFRKDVGMGQEGRHRALAAELLGDKKIPVYIKYSLSDPPKVLEKYKDVTKDFKKAFLELRGYAYDSKGNVVSASKGGEGDTSSDRFLVTQYGVPERWFQYKEEAMDYAKRMGERAVYEIDDSADALERPPVTVDNLKALQPGEPLLKLSAGGYPTEAIRRFNELMIALPTLESPEDYTRGVIDIVYQVQAIYNQVAVNVDIASIYENYGKAIAEGREPEAMSVEMEALRPLLQVFDALGHYFDPSGKSLTQKFYLPTMLKPNKKVSILDAILGKDDVVDVDNPVDGGLDDILLDPTRVGDSGFWQQRSGDLFRDAEGNFTMDKAAPLEDAVVAYTVSALTRGKNKLYVAAQNEVARSKFDRNRAQITSKQALAGLKDADTVRTKAKAIQAKISKDAEALAELKENYSGDESTIDKAIEEKNYADELDYTRSVNTMAQKLGFNQFMQMNNIPGTVARFGANSTGFRGIANIRRKLEKINVTGTMWVERFGEKVNVGFGLEPTPSNQQIYGSFKPEKAINLGQLINMNFDSDRAAVVFLNQINEKIATWAEGDGWDLMATISEFARENFPLSDSEWYTAQLMKKLGQNYNSFHDPEEIFIANAEAISGWITRGTLDTFNKAIQMSNITNLDNRTIRALDEAAAYMLIGTPVKRSKIINYAQEAAVWSALGLNPRVAIGNMLNEPLRLIDVVGYRGFAKAWSTALNPKEAARINSIISDLPSRFDNPEMVGLAEKAKGTFGKLKEKAASIALSPLEKSEQFKNILFWAAAEDNARARFPGDPKRQLQETLRFFNDYAIAGGKGTVPGVATGSFGRTLNIFKTFTLRNFDDFIDYVQKVARGESGNNYWDNKYEKKHGGKNYKDKTGRNKFDPKIAARVIGGRVFRSYLFWLLVGSYFGKSFTDALGGDPSGITEGGFDRGLYDDPDTNEYEGMTGFDNFINSLPAGFILGFLQDVYFAARRRGIESKQFLGFDIMNDPRFTKSLESKLPLGVAKNRFADMLDLVDRGYSFSSTGRKTYAAPETALDTIKGFLFGKATTQNSLAYGKYRYGMVDVWGDLSSGDWMDFAMNAVPSFGNATFDTTRKDYTGVFNGGWNDISTMQLIIQQFRKRNEQIIADFQKNKYRYRGEYEGLTDEEKLAKAKEQREKDIDAFTDDVTRAVDAFEKAGNTLNDNQITNIMYLFDFHEGEEDEEWNSSYARKRYVEAGLPDYNAAAIERGEKTVNGEKQEVTKGMLDRSLVLENAQQGFYGSSKEAANAVKSALKDFKSVYKEYNTRVKALNEKYFEARKKNKKSSETKQLNKDIEALQNEYLDRLYNQLSPVVEQYGTALIGTYDVADVLEEYMGNMIPYSSIKKYGQTYSSGNDIVYGQLTEWLQKRWGRNGPTAPSDKEVTSGIEEIRNLLDQGKTASARSKARAILEKIGRGSLGARRDDVETLRDYAYD